MTPEIDAFVQEQMLSEVRRLEALLVDACRRGERHVDVPVVEQHEGWSIRRVTLFCDCPGGRR